MSQALRQIIADNRAGRAVAVPSICSAHPAVIEASLLLARSQGQPIVIEATSNQVNQDGGYTGMTAPDFVGFVTGIAQSAGISPRGIIFGGDHLGPQVWRARPAAEAMDKARDLVAGYAAAGFTKLHLDCSEGCAGEAGQLPDALTAARSADLAAVALRAELGANRGVSLPKVMQSLMLADTRYWQGHYPARAPDLPQLLHIGLADRIRYYWPQPAAEAALAALFADLGGVNLPDAVILAHFSHTELASARQSSHSLPRALALARVQTALRPYFFLPPLQ